MKQKKLAVLGLGHIGKHIYRTLRKNDVRLDVTGYDLSLGHDLSDSKLLLEITKNNDGVVASTPYFLNEKIALACFINKTAYFDLTESNEVADYIKTLEASAPMITQCGLAPGMVSVIAQMLSKQFANVKSIAIRVGALPSTPNNHMGYALTWNTEGLINEYIHQCKAVVNGKLVAVEPLENVEPVNMFGIQLEAANTSGGIGSLAETWEGKAESITYKTLRYPGHWNLMRFLKEDLRLKDNFDTFVKIFNSSIPNTTNDKIFVLVKVIGEQNGKLVEAVYEKIILPVEDSTAIQVSTAAGVMAVVDVWAAGQLNHLKGLVKQEELPLECVFNSDYARCYR